MVDKIVTLAQLALSILFIAGYFTMVIMFLLGYVRVPLDYKEAFIGFIGVVTGSVITIVSFWFNRSRAASPVDPTADPTAHNPPTQ